MTKLGRSSQSQSKGPSALTKAVTNTPHIQKITTATQEFKKISERVRNFADEDFENDIHKYGKKIQTKDESISSALEKNAQPRPNNEIDPELAKRYESFGMYNSETAPTKPQERTFAKSSNDYSKNHPSKLDDLQNLMDDLNVQVGAHPIPQVQLTAEDNLSQTQLDFYKRQLNKLVDIANKADIHMNDLVPEQEAYSTQLKYEKALKPEKKEPKKKAYETAAEFSKRALDKQGNLLHKSDTEKKGSVSSQNQMPITHVQARTINREFDKILAGTSESLTLNVGSQKHPSHDVVEYVEQNYVNRKSLALIDNSELFVKEATFAAGETLTLDDQNSLRSFYLAQEREHYKQDPDNYVHKHRTMATDIALKKVQSKNSKALNNYPDHSMKDMLQEEKNNQNLQKTAALYEKYCGILRENKDDLKLSGVMQRHLDRCAPAPEIEAEPAELTTAESAITAAPTAEQEKPVEPTKVAEKTQQKPKAPKQQFKPKNLPDIEPGDELNSFKKPNQSLEEQQEAARKAHKAEVAREMTEERAKANETRRVSLKEQIDASEASINSKSSYLQEHGELNAIKSDFVSVAKAKAFEQLDSNGVAFKESKQVRAAALAMNKSLEAKQFVGGLHRKTDDGEPNPEYKALEKEFGLDSAESMEELNKENEKTVRGRSFVKARDHIAAVDQELDAELERQGKTTEYQIYQINNSRDDRDDNSEPTR